MGATPAVLFTGCKGVLAFQSLWMSSWVTLVVVLKFRQFDCCQVSVDWTSPRLVLDKQCANSVMESQVDAPLFGACRYSCPPICSLDEGSLVFVGTLRFFHPPMFHIY